MNGWMVNALVCMAALAMIAVNTWISAKWRRRAKFTGTPECEFYCRHCNLYGSARYCPVCDGKNAETKLMGFPEVMRTFPVGDSFQCPKCGSCVTGACCRGCGYSVTF